MAKKTPDDQATPDAETTAAEDDDTLDAAAGADEDDKKAWDEFEEADKKDAKAATPPEDRAEATPADAEPAEPPADADAPADQPADAAGEAGEPATPPDDGKVLQSTLQSDPAGQETKADEDEIWTEATDAQRGAFKTAQERAAAAEAQDRRTRGSISGMQRQINDLTRQLDAGKAAKPGDGDETGTEADTEWADFAKEYPEVAGPVEKRLSAKDERIDTLERSLAAVSVTHKAQLYEHNEERLAKQHPDWEAVMGVEGSQENPVDVTAAANRFATWLGQQPAYLQQAAIRNSDSIMDPEEAGHVIQVYKLANGIGQQAPAPGTAPGAPQPRALSGKRQRQIESAAAPRTPGPGPVTSGVPEEGDPKALWDGLEKAGL